jgi:hypothetical protein
MPLLEPKIYRVIKTRNGIEVTVPFDVEKTCQLRFIGAEWKAVDACWIIKNPQTRQAAQLFELYPTARFDGDTAKMAACYWRKVAEGRADHYGEIGYKLSPTDAFRPLSADDLRKKYGDQVIDWLQAHGERPGE